MNRFHHTRTGEGFIVYDRHRPIQSAKRCATEDEAIAAAAEMKAEQETLDKANADAQGHTPGHKHG